MSGVCSHSVAAKRARCWCAVPRQLHGIGRVDRPDRLDNRFKYTGECIGL